MPFTCDQTDFTCDTTSFTCDKTVITFDNDVAFSTSHVLSVLPGTEVNAARADGVTASALEAAAVASEARTLFDVDQGLLPAVVGDIEAVHDFSLTASFSATGALLIDGQASFGATFDVGANGTADFAEALAFLSTHGDAETVTMDIPGIAGFSFTADDQNTAAVSFEASTILNFTSSAIFQQLLPFPTLPSSRTLKVGGQNARIEPSRPPLKG